MKIKALIFTFFIFNFSFSQIKYLCNNPHLNDIDTLISQELYHLDKIDFNHLNDDIIKLKKVFRCFTNKAINNIEHNTAYFHLQENFLFSDKSLSIEFSDSISITEQNNIESQLKQKYVKVKSIIYSPREYVDFIFPDSLLKDITINIDK
jgi:hypothetical protein